MRWNPFDFGSHNERDAALISEQLRNTRLQKHEKQMESFRAIAIGLVVPLFATVVLKGTEGFKAYWLTQPILALVIQIAACVAGFVSMIMLSRIALRRYALTPDSPAVPLWFRTLLALLELGYSAAMIAFFLILGADVGKGWLAPELAFWLFPLAAVLAVVGRLLRWRAAPFGWETGRLFWDHFD